MSLRRGEQKGVLPFKVSLEGFSEEVTWEPRPKPTIWYDLERAGQHQDKLGLVVAQHTV